MLYKCKYCDTVFDELHTVCPNCGGNQWLTADTESTEETPKPEPEPEPTPEPTVESSFQSGAQFIWNTCLVLLLSALAVGLFIHMMRLVL